MENIAPPQEPASSPPKGKKTKLKIRISVKNEAEAQLLADVAATTINPKTNRPFRRGGLPIWKKKPHGWAGQVDLNGKGIGPMLKHLFYMREAILAGAKAQADLQAVMEGKKK